MRVAGFHHSWVSLIRVHRDGICGDVRCREGHIDDDARRMQHDAKLSCCRCWRSVDLSSTDGKGSARWLERGSRWRSGFLHCAAHDKTVSSFGRNDGFLAVGEGERKATAIARTKATAAATTTAKANT